MARLHSWGNNGKNECANLERTGPAGVVFPNNVVVPTPAPQYVGVDVRGIAAPYFGGYAMDALGKVTHVGGCQDAQGLDGYYEGHFPPQPTPPNPYDPVTNKKGETYQPSVAYSPRPCKLPPCKKISASGAHALVLTRQARVLAGGGNSTGILGTGTSAHGVDHQAGKKGDPGFMTIEEVIAAGYIVIEPFEPPLPPLPAKVHPIDVITGQTVSAITLSDHTLLVCGENPQGIYGDGTTESNYRFKFSLLTGVKQVDTSGQFLAAVKLDGTAWTTGMGEHGQRGDGHIYHSHPPLEAVQVKLPPGVKAKKVATGQKHLEVLATNGDLYEAGLPPGIKRDAPIDEAWGTPRKIASKVRDVWCGDYTTFVAPISGGMMSKGDNYYWQLGFNTEREAEPELRFVSFTPLDIATGEITTLALAA